MFAVRNPSYNKTRVHSRWFIFWRWWAIRDDLYSETLYTHGGYLVGFLSRKLTRVNIRVLWRHHNYIPRYMM